MELVSSEHFKLDPEASFEQGHKGQTVDTEPAIEELKAKLEKVAKNQTFNKLKATFQKVLKPKAKLEETDSDAEDDFEQDSDAKDENKMDSDAKDENRMDSDAMDEIKTDSDTMDEIKTDSDAEDDFVKDSDAEDDSDKDSEKGQKTRNRQNASKVISERGAKFQGMLEKVGKKYPTILELKATLEKVIKPKPKLEENPEEKDSGAEDDLDTEKDSETFEKGQKILTFVSNDDKVFKASWETACQSITLRNMLNDLGIEYLHEGTDEIKESIPLLGVNAKCLKKILEWCKLHQGDPDVQLEDEIDNMILDDREDEDLPELTDWEIEFTNLPLNELFDLLNAANYLNVPGLVILFSKGLARIFYIKNMKEIQDDLGLKDPKWTAEQLQQFEEEEAWVYD